MDLLKAGGTRQGSRRESQQEDTKTNKKKKKTRKAQSPKMQRFRVAAKEKLTKVVRRAWSHRSRPCGERLSSRLIQMAISYSHWTSN